MKYILAILLFTSINLQAQKRYEPYKVIGLYSASIVLNAIGDGLNDSGHKQWGHACNAASIGTMIATPFILKIDKKNWGGYFASYALLRFSLFDYTYNTTRRLPLGYIGNSATSDKFMRLVSPPEGSILFARAITMTAGISVTFRYCKGSRMNKNKYYKKSNCE